MLQRLLSMYAGDNTYLRISDLDRHTDANVVISSLQLRMIL